MNLQVSSLIEIRRWVLYWGADCRVLEPEELREQIREAAIARMMGGPDSLSKTAC